MPSPVRLILASLALFTLAAPTFGQSACRQALALGLDVSSSVDAREYRLQLDGTALALLDPEVQTVLLSQPQAPLALAIYEWSSQDNQSLLVDWTLIKSAGDLAAIAARLTAQQPASGTRTTALGAAITYGGNLLARAPDCWQATLDISGDGKNNDGYRPLKGRAHPIFATATINGLVIGADVPSGDQIVDNEVAELTAYFRDEVINGPNAFIQTAIGFRDFQAAMRQKLLRETTIALSQLKPPRQDP